MQDNPVTPLPVYYIHSFYEPFCKNPLCLCRSQQQRMNTLFAEIIGGKLELEKVSTFTQKEKKQ